MICIRQEHMHVLPILADQNLSAKQKLCTLLRSTMTPMNSRTADEMRNLGAYLSDVWKQRVSTRHFALELASGMLPY